MIPGITDKEFEKIYLPFYNKYDGEFYAYGSRVKGDFSDLSDLDILVKSENYEQIISNLKYEFDQSLLPYIVNFADFHSMDNHFYNLIKDSLVRIK